MNKSSSLKDSKSSVTLQREKNVIPSRPKSIRTVGIYYPLSHLHSFVCYTSEKFRSIFSTLIPEKNSVPIRKTVNTPHICLPEIFQLDNTKIDIDKTINTMNTGETYVSKHRTRRQKKIKKIIHDKKRVHYEMNLVPNFEKNEKFLLSLRLQILSENNSYERSLSDPSSFLSINSYDNENSRKSKHTSNESKLQSKRLSISYCRKCSIENFKYIDKDNSSDMKNYFDKNSIIWVPNTRSEWEDCIEELTAVCTSAAWRRHEGKKKRDFSPPLSSIYIRDRIDIDDPLRGYQIRHKNGWLQGFVMMTTFTTWTHYFKWDSKHPKNGITVNENKIGLFDDGSMSTILEMQPRSGDPLTGGVIWPNIAEIGLVGALGCGEYLVQMALDDIKRRGTYDFVVLQATETSRLFYERFGFIRVGAVSKYGSQEDVAEDNDNIEVVGYRHWTYANESSQRLNEHGAPSCMMACKIICNTQIDNSMRCSKCNELLRLSILGKLSTSFVSVKPTIEPIDMPVKSKTIPRIMSSREKVIDGNNLPSRSKRSVGKHALSGRKRSPKRLCSIDSAQTVQHHSLSVVNVNKPSKHSLESMFLSRKTENLLVSSKIDQVAKPKLRKQKIMNMYRDPKKVYFYNKVVTPKVIEGLASPYKSTYYFVLNYEEDVKMIRLIPLYHIGTFKGKREGKAKWKAVVLGRDDDLDEIKYYQSMGIITSPCSKWDIVPSQMVTKCASVADESWDINGKIQKSCCTSN